MLVNVQLPPGATREPHARRDAAGRGLHAEAARGAEHGRACSASASPARARTPALAFVTLKDWDEREGAEHSRRRRWPAARSARCRASAMRSSSRSSPPPIPELGTASGFTFRLQDRGGNGHDALVAARNQLLGLAAQSKVLAQRAARRPGGRAAAAARHRPRQGQRAGRAASTRSTPRSPPRSARPTSTTSRTRGRLQRVVVQADAPARMQPDDLLRLNAHQQRRASRCRCRPSPPRAGSPGRCRPCATTAIRRCASPATPRRATAPARRWPRWSAWRRSCRPASATSGPASRARKSSPARRR